MDQQVNDFFNINGKIEHNKDALMPPDGLTVEDYFQWIRRESRCKSLKLKQVDVKEIQQEVKSKTSLAIAHRGHPGWRSITLFGYSSIMTNSYEHYKQAGIITDDIEPTWTDVCRFFPKTVEWIKANNPLKDFVRIRLMILDPGGSSSPHKDYQAGQFLCGPINAAIINPNGAEFVLENGGIVPWSEGEFRTMDLGSIHCIRNLGNEERVHLIITPNKEWDYDAKKLACESYTRMKNDSRRT